MSSQAALVPASSGLSQFERVADTFVAPSKTFADILRDASWWLPLILLIVSSTAATWFVQKEVGFDRVYMNQLHSSPAQEDRINGLPPDQKARAVEMGVKFSAIFGYALPVLIVIFLAIYALILWASFNFGLGAQTTYWQVFAVTFYAALPYIIQSVLIILTVQFGGNAEAFDSKNPVGTNPAYYLPDAAGWLKGLLASFDVIKLWAEVLQVIGMAIIAKKTILQSAVIVGIFWLLGVIAGTVGGAFSG
jgi:hypothetical protein